MTLVVDALAAFRLTRLVIEDHLTEGWRRKVVVDSFIRHGMDVPEEETAADIVASAERLGAPFVPKPARLITCPWCAGFWISLGVVAARRYAPRVWGPIAAVFATSAIVGLVQENG